MAYANFPNLSFSFYNIPKYAVSYKSDLRR